MGVQAGTRLAGTLTDLTAEFTGWHVWRGRDGRGSDQGWFATRRKRLSPAEGEAGLVATLSAGDAAALHGMLEQQRVIGERVTGSMP